MHADTVATAAATSTARVTTAPSDPAPGVTPGRFDTGKMWTFENAPLDYFQEAYGFRPTAEWLSHLRLAALRLPDCTASFVSSSGLVMTNHHCARSSVSAVTRPGETLLDSGFIAARLEDERKVPDLYVDQLVEMRDVTADVQAAGRLSADEQVQSQARDAKIAEIEGRVGAETHLRCSATSLYHGGRYSLYCYRRYTDLRLVFAPEASVSFFGGDPDNFTYPRYDLDVSFFRVYDETGKPLHPDQYLRWSAAGAREGDPVFVVGNPGQTSRLKTVAQLEYDRDTEYPYLVRVLESRTAILLGYIAQHPERRAAVINDYFELSNALKAYRGQLDGLRTPSLFQRKVAFERDFRRAVEADTGLRRQYGNLWSEISDTRASIKQIAPRLNALNQGGILRSRTMDVSTGLVQYAPAARSGQVPDSVLRAFRDQLLAQKIDAALDALVLAAQLTEARDALGENDAFVRQALAGRTPVEAARAIVSASPVVDSASRARLIADPALVAVNADAALQLARAALPRLVQLEQQVQQLTAGEDLRTARLAEALFRVKGTSLAPDATFTLRLSDGIIKGYDYNGTHAPAFTTFFGMYDRHYGNPANPDWALPARWLNPPPGFDLRTPLDLVATNDIIGGNSGSPMVNARGEIVGLIFDGNIESLPGDFIYDSERNRAVAVHSQGILAALRDVYRATRLVTELAPVPAR
jgi:hypothetical protein